MQADNRSATGKWISNNPYIGWHCSECGQTNEYAFVWDDELEKYIKQDHYCPNCGAKMEQFNVIKTRARMVNNNEKVYDK